MENLINTVLAKVRAGATVRVDFKRLKIVLNGKELTVEGTITSPRQCADMNEWLKEAEQRYYKYKFSRPSAAFDKLERKARFKALSVSELIKQRGHMALANPDDRVEALVELELFIMLSVVNGSFKPQELFATKWFYQGTDKAFILRKEWFI